MRRISIFFCLAWSAPAALAQTTDIYSSARLAEALPLVEQIRDLASWFGPKPPPSPEFNYTETRAFDMQLHQSMKAGLDRINVRVSTPMKLEAVPQRMNQWLRAVERTGGMTRICIENGDKGLFDALKLLLSIFDKLDKFVLYRPARNYDTMLLASPQSIVRSIYFTTRGAATACPAGFHEQTAQ